LKVANAPGEPVDPRHHEDITLAHEIEDGAQLLTPCRGRAAALFGPNDLAPGGAERVLLDRQVLVGGADASDVRAQNTGALAVRQSTATIRVQ
jgi:hypothetical protein